MHIAQALAIVEADAARIRRFIDRRERFLDALDWSLLPDALARECAMLDDLLAGDLAEAQFYADWLAGRFWEGVIDIPGVLRFAPHPRPWQPEWITLGE